jgi:NDP-sugar pyrophosphorylase family protein
MKAMVLAAGLGTRLRPLTNDRPKALVEVAGRTMLEITLARLRAFGIREVIVNVHHFAEMVIDYLRTNDNFGMHIEVSREETLLDTGGGLKKAAWFLKDSDPFLLHNVDILSSFDLDAMISAHAEKQALATLAVQQRESSRHLLFNEELLLRGRQSRGDAARSNLQPLAFAGIHVISPELLVKMTEDGAFSIIDTYVRIAAEGEEIRGYRDDAAYWCDLGRPESVAQAAKELLGAGLDSFCPGTGPWGST